MAPTVWYYVRDLDSARRFYRDTLLFGELLFDPEENWVTTERGGMEIGLSQGDPTEEGGVAHVDVDDLKAEAERLRAAGAEVGIVVELGGEIRLLDVFDPDGNRLQFAQELRAS
ncbi:MAG TPA: VOC family protein [Gaiellaceae bacterium]|jgi:predicted enzyme related to lactoylglutathione lyase